MALGGFGGISQVGQEGVLQVYGDAIGVVEHFPACGLVKDVPKGGETHHGVSKGPEGCRLCEGCWGLCRVCGQGLLRVDYDFVFLGLYKTIVHNVFGFKRFCIVGGFLQSA